ncbi:MAG: hypothetical protein FWC20_10785 [Oscillospiraceae bacterium]|nr:hypothetical protein [Oscillospiraceae bacterium]
MLLFKDVLDKYIEIRKVAYLINFSIKSLAWVEKVLLLLYAASAVILLISVVTIAPTLMIIGLSSIFTIMPIIIVYTTRQDKKRRDKAKDNYDAKIDLFVEYLDANELHTNNGVDWLIYQCEKAIKENNLAEIFDWFKKFSSVVILPAFILMAGILANNLEESQIIDFFTIIITLVIALFLIGFVSFTLSKSFFAKYIELKEDLLYIKAKLQD